MATPIPSKAAVKGHPIHPALIPFPIAFLTAAFVTDIVYLVVGDPGWARASLWLLGAGVVSAFVAMVPGFVDYLGIREVRRHAVARRHMLANVAATGIATANFAARLQQVEASVAPAGVTLSAVTAALLAYSGWLGGELAYRHLIGAAPADEHPS